MCSINDLGPTDCRTNWTVQTTTIFVYHLHQLRLVGVHANGSKCMQLTPQGHHDVMIVALYTIKSGWPRPPGARIKIPIGR